MLIINHRDVEQVFTMPIAIDVMREALLSLERGDAVQPARTAMTLPGDRGIFWIMPAVGGTPASLGLKALTAYPCNHGTAFDTHQGAVLLFGEHGELLALVDATALTATDPPDPVSCAPNFRAPQMTPRSPKSSQKASRTRACPAPGR